VYSDESEVIKTFASEKEAAWFIHNEGDHIVYCNRIVAG
jgi:hypothetical protein